MSESIKLKVTLNSLLFTNKAKTQLLSRLEDTLADCKQPFRSEESDLHRIQVINKDIRKAKQSIEDAKAETIMLKGVISRLLKSCAFHKKKTLEIEDHYRRVSKFSFEFHRSSLCSQQSASIARSHLNNTKLAVKRSRIDYKQKHAKLSSRQASLTARINSMLKRALKERTRFNSLSIIRRKNKESVNEKLYYLKGIVTERNDARNLLQSFENRFGKLKKMLNIDNLGEIAREYNKRQSREIALMKEYEDLLTVNSAKQQELDSYIEELNIFKECGIINTGLFKRYPSFNIMKESIEDRNESKDIVKSYEKLGIINILHFSTIMWNYVNLISKIDEFALSSYPNTKIISSKIRDVILSLQKNKTESEKNDLSSVNPSVRSLFLSKFPNKEKECRVFCSLMNNNMLVKSFIKKEDIEEFLAFESAETASENVIEIYRNSNNILKKQYKKISSSSIELFQCINTGKTAENLVYSEYILPSKIRSPKEPGYFLNKPTQGSSTSRVPTPKKIKRPNSMSDRQQLVQSKGFMLKEILDLDQKLKKLRFHDIKAQKTNALLKNRAKFRAFIPKFMFRSKSESGFRQKNN